MFLTKNFLINNLLKGEMISNISSLSLTATLRAETS